MLKGYGSRPLYSNVDHRACALASEYAYTGAGSHVAGICSESWQQHKLLAVPAGIQAVLAQEHHYWFFFSPLPSSLYTFSLPLSAYPLMWPPCKGHDRVMGAGWIYPMLHGVPKRGVVNKVYNVLCLINERGNHTERTN